MFQYGRLSKYSFSHAVYCLWITYKKQSFIHIRQISCMFHVYEQNDFSTLSTSCVDNLIFPKYKSKTFNNEYHLSTLALAQKKQSFRYKTVMHLNSQKAQKRPAPKISFSAGLLHRVIHRIVDNLSSMWKDDQSSRKK